MGSLFWSIFLSRTYIGTNQQEETITFNLFPYTFCATYIAQKSNPSLKIWNLSGGGGGGGSLIGSQ